MKTLIAYYSKTGKNKTAAEMLSARLKADLDEIKDTRDVKGIGIPKAILAILLKKKEKIKTEKNPKDYEFTVLVTPVWAGHLPPAVRTYLEENRDRIKENALLSVSGSGDKNKDFPADYEKALGKKAKATMLLTEKEENTGNIEGFAQKITG